MKRFAYQNQKGAFAIAACLLIAAITMSFQEMTYGILQNQDSFADMQDTIPETAQPQDYKMKQHDY